MSRVSRQEMGYVFLRLGGLQRILSSEGRALGRASVLVRDDMEKPVMELIYFPVGSRKT